MSHMGGPEQSAMNHVVHVMCGKNDIAQFRDVRVAIAVSFWVTHRKIEAEFAAGAGGAYVKVWRLPCWGVVPSVYVEAANVVLI